MCVRLVVLNCHEFIFHLERRRQKNKLYMHKLGDLVSPKSSAKEKADLSWDMLARLQLDSAFC